MKRIIDGVTYNTDTSTLLARSEYESEYNHQSCRCIGTMYQTRGGAFFEMQQLHVGWDDEAQQEDYRYRFETLNADQAQKWLLTGEVEVIHNPFDEPPEAEAEHEPGATIYVRVPVSLKKRLDAAARGDGVSGNAWAMRCVENCLRGDERKQLLQSYLNEKLPTNGRGEITAARLRETLAGVADIVAAW